MHEQLRNIRLLLWSVRSVHVTLLFSILLIHYLLTKTIVQVKAQEMSKLLLLTSTSLKLCYES